MATGVELGHFSKRSLESRKVPSAIITKLEPFLLKSKKELESAGSHPDDLVLTISEASQ